MHVIDNAANAVAPTSTAARAPATSVPSPAMTGRRLPAKRFAASAIATSSAADLPRIQASAMRTSFRSGVISSVVSLMFLPNLLVVFDVGEACILLRRTFQRSTVFGGLPLNDLFDLFGQLEILVGDALGRVVL